MSNCPGDDCGLAPGSRGMCNKHYLQWLARTPPEIRTPWARAMRTECRVGHDLTKGGRKSDGSCRSCRNSTELARQRAALDDAAAFRATASSPPPDHSPRYEYQRQWRLENSDKVAAYDQRHARYRLDPAVIARRAATSLAWAGRAREEAAAYRRLTERSTA